MAEARAVNGRSRRTWFVSVAGVSVAAVVAGLFLWWDTNVFGSTELCAGKLTGEQAESSRHSGPHLGRRAEGRR